MTETSPTWEFMREWWRALEPWFHLGRSISKPLHGSQQFAFGPLILRAPRHGEDVKSQSVVDALELVMLQRAVDEHAFMEMVRELFGDPASPKSEWDDFLPESVIPCGGEFVLDTAHYSRTSDDGAWVTRRLSTLLKPVPVNDRDNLFREARTKILAIADKQTRHEIDENHWTIPMSVGLQFQSEALLAAAVKHVILQKQAMDAVLAHSDDAAEEMRRAALRAFPFRAVAVDVAVMDWKISKKLQQAFDQVTRTEGLQLRDVQYSSGHYLPRQTLGSIVRNLTNAAPSVPGSLILPCYEVDDKMGVIEYTHFLSALLQSRQFDSVCLAHTLDAFVISDRNEMWRWIAHALFSSAANRKITTFELEINILTEADVAAVRSYVEAKNPVALLCYRTWELASKEESVMRPRKRVALPQGIHAWLSTSPTTKCFMSLPSGGWYDVIQENEGYVDVVVPAYGQCIVRKDNVTKWEDLPDSEPVTVRKHHPIKSLVLTVSKRYGSQYTTSSIQALLELVGEPLESLEINCTTTPSDIFLDAVWAACPNLKMIKIGQMQFPSLDYFIDAYETGKCRVQSLCLSSCSVNDASSRMRLFEALEGPESRTKLASTLREFSFSEGSNRGVTSDEWKEIADKLRSNPTLRYIGLGNLGGKWDALVPVFKPLRDQFLRGQRRPLLIRQKCALLSIVKHASDPVYAVSIQVAGLIAQLDSGVLSVILGFAAQPIKRSVSLKRR